MQFLATPWRMAYIEQARDDEGCPFCRLLTDGRDDGARFVLRRGERAFLVMNIYPYTPGHLLAVPYAHAPSPAALPAETHAELLDLCDLAERLLRRAFGCRSVHVGANLGRAAGAGVPDHVHYHIVGWPEGEVWEQCCAATGLPESLEATYGRFRSLLPELLEPPAPGGAG